MTIKPVMPIYHSECLLTLKPYFFKTDYLSIMKSDNNPENVVVSIISV